MSDDYLRVYLNDHLAGAKAGLQLARDCLSHNPTGPLGAFLWELVAEIEKENDVLKDLYSRVHPAENPAKKAVMWLASKASRLKLENALSRYTDLSRLEELEGLTLGVHGKRKLWLALQDHAATDERFGDVDFQALQELARNQHDQLEHYRRAAARKAFSQR
jgi:hypothetical protein